MNKFDKVPSANSDTWNNAEGMQNGMPCVIRYRPELERFFGMDNYHKRLVIFWDFDGKSSNGMPSEAESSRMKAFEDLLISALDYDRTAVLVLVYTCSGTREWHFYLCDITEVKQRVNEKLASEESFPIQLQVEDDSNWKKLRQVYSLFS